MEKIGKYQILREIGQGGMGKVYQARDPVLGRIVAIKLMSEAQLVDEEMRARFYREAQAAGNLKHPNIITIYDLSEEKGVPYIVMEYLEGTDLKQLLKERKDLPLYDRLKIAIQVTNGLAYAHQHGIVHRDVKPGNIRVLADGQVKIMDFGIARVAASEMTKTGLTIGTWHYMSPEQIVGKKVDNRADIWAVGVILFEMLTDRRPFEADSLTALVYKIAHDQPPSFQSLGVEVPEPLAQIIFRALAKESADRYPDAMALSRALEGFTTALSTSVEQLRTEIERDIRKYIQLGTALLLRKQFGEASEAARRALVLDPGSSEAKALLEQIDRGRERGEREEKALALAEESRKLLGKARYEEAMLAAARAHALAPESTKVGRIKAEVAAEVEKARRERALGERLKAGRRAMEAGKRSEAAAELRAALDIDPANAEAKKLLVSVNEAARIAEERKQRQGIRAKARAAFERKAYGEARQMLEEYLRRAPEDGEARALLRELLESQTMASGSTSVETVVSAAPGPARAPVAEELLPPESIARARPPAPRPPELEEPTTRRRKAAAVELPAPAVRESEAGEAPTGVAASRRAVYVGIGAAVAVGVVLAVAFLREAPPPAAAGPGFASIDIAPWAEIRSLKEVVSGQPVEPDLRVTPCFLTLPAGKYEFQFVNPHFPQSLTVPLEVKPGETVELRGALPGFNHADFIPDF